MKYPPWQLVVVGLGVIGVYQIWTKGIRTLNPANPENPANRAVNSIVAELSGDGSLTFGGWIYELTHKSPDFRSPVTVKSPTPTPHFHDPIYGD